ncbi:unnamed protein product, partial [Polarella glacialis]
MTQKALVQLQVKGAEGLEVVLLSQRRLVETVCSLWQSGLRHKAQSGDQPWAKVALGAWRRFLSAFQECADALLRTEAFRLREPEEVSSFI